MRIIVFILLVVAFFGVEAQKVAVVMSGGAAKGLAHVGALKALEENEIPIDFVVGTSMGGIVAGCYAAGMSPYQIEEILLSEDLTRWVRGEMESGYNYFYNKDDVRPSFLRLNLLLDSALSLNLNASIANDLALNFAIAEKMAQPIAIARGNFDSLFVPLRLVASEIFTQREVILKSGSLGDAMRATQTVPFFYSPIRIDGKYLFDGGVYNNFPVDIAQNEFKPDIIIGNNVASKIYEDYPKDDEKLISKSLLYLLLDKANPGQMPSNGIYVEPNLKGITGFDFAKAKAIIDSGYNETMRRMPEIKSKIAARITCEEVAKKRNAFNSRTSPLLVDHIVIDGMNTKQQRYINRFFNSRKRPLHYSDIKSGYYHVVAEDYFKNIYPSFSFDSTTNHFNFLLTKRPQNNFQVDFGGVIATRYVSNIYLGLNYYYFSRLLTHASVNFYTGSFYQSAQAKARLDFSGFSKFYLEPEALFNSWNFIEGNDIIINRTNSTVLKRIDRKVGMSLGLPLGKQYRISMEGYYISNNDQYINNDVLVSTDTLDQLILTGSRYSLNISTSNLNRKQYASTGKSYYFAVDLFNLRESTIPGSTASNQVPVDDEPRRWIRGTLIMEQYVRKGIYSSGYYLHATFSNQPLFANYQATIINAPGFFPMQDSRTLLLQNFRSFNFIAGGWRNVFSLLKKLDFRLEGYLFKPLESIQQGKNQEPVLDTELSQFFFAGTAGLVLHSAIGPISLSVNYYDDKKTQLGVLLHFGFLLFNKTSLE